MFNSEYISHILKTSVKNNGQAPDSNLFVFSEEENDIVNFNNQKWQMQVQEFIEGDVIKFGTRLDEPMPRVFDIIIFWSVFKDVLFYNGLE